MDRNVDMFLQVEKSLVGSRSLNLPQIFIRPDVDKALVPKLKDIIKRHRGGTVETPEEASHIVCPAIKEEPDAEGMKCSLMLK